MKIMHGHLKNPVEIGMSGALSTARDPAEVIEQLSLAPGKFRVILNWAGELPEGHRASGIVEHTFEVTVSHNRGLLLMKGLNVFEPRGDQKPLMTLSGMVRDHLRTLCFPNGVTNVTLTYGGTVPVQVDGTNIDAFTQTWRLKASLPAALT